MEYRIVFLRQTYIQTRSGKEHSPSALPKTEGINDSQASNKGSKQHKEQGILFILQYMLKKTQTINQSNELRHERQR